jgi:hypothetical protein
MTYFLLVAFPPRRYSTELVRVTKGALKFVSLAMLRRSQLPDPVITPTGLRIRRPVYWK